VKIGSPTPEAGRDLISAVQESEQLNRLYAVVVFSITLALGIALFLSVVSNLSRSTAWIVLGLLLVACSWVWRPGIRTITVSRIEAAALVDRALGTKERAVSLAELENRAFQEHGAQRQVLATQLAELVPEGVTGARIAPYVVTQAERRAIVVALLCVAALLAIVLLRPRSPLDDLVQAITEIETEHPELPAEVQSALIELVEQASDPRAESADILQGIARVEGSIKSASRQQRGKQADKSGAQAGDTAQDSKQGQQGEQGQQVKQGQQGGQGQQGQQGEQGQQGDQGKQGEEQGDKQGGSRSGAQAGDAAQESKQEQQGEQGQQGKQGQQGGQVQQGEQHSQEKQKSPEKAGTADGAGKESDRPGEQSKHGSADQGIAKLQNALTKAKEALKPKAQGGSQSEAQNEAQNKPQSKPQSKPQGKPQSENNSSTATKEQNKGREEGDQKRGDRGTQDQGEPAKRLGIDQGGEDGSLGSTGARSPQIDRNAKAREGGFDPNAPEGRIGLGGREKFKDVQIEARDEEIDERFAGDDLKPESGDQGAQPKTTLEELTLAKPKSVPHKGQQPIPLEYRDLLR
jgi:hypothetical protein